MKETNPGREAYQRTAFADALAALRDLVNAREVFVWHGLPGVPTLHSALAHALHHIGAEPLERMPQQEDDEEALAEALQGVGVMYRKVDLAPGWHRAAMGTMLLRGEDGEYRILLPSRGGYDLYDYRRQTRTRVGRAQAAALRGTVYVLYPPLPPGRLTGRDLLRFFLRQLSWGDAIAVIMATLAITLLGLIMPKAIQVLYTTIIPGEYADVLAPLLLLLCCIPVSLLLLRVVRGVYVQRVSSRLSLFSYAAVMGRLLQLPVSFFREYDPGELSKRVTASTQLSGTMADTVLTTGISGLLSLIYLAQIASFARAFLLPAAAVAAVSIGISAMAVVREGRHAARLSRDSIVLTGELYDYLSDIQKIKVSGVERLVFANWTNTYIKAAAHRYVRPFLLRMGAALSEAVMAVGMLAIYLIAAGKGVGIADFVAFTASFGMLMGALGSMVAVVQNVAQIAPDFRSAMPLFQAVPEKVPTRRGVQTVQGRLRLEHVSFGYAPELPTILDDLSLDIAEGEYLGIVGRTGCGKSTLLRLLLGFERPVRGTVYFDENDLGSVDLQSFRRHLGVVLQSGSLIAGTILENITLAAPWLSEEDAWEAARIACIDGDIRRLPMGMRTLISAKSSGISGGQKQRIMIARAVAANPSVLLMDEATSSLDNETQAEIAATLDGLRCTRVVVAHRLSTVERCDRIVVLDGGRIAEEGTYRQLMERDGVFAELVRRQQVD